MEIDELPENDERLLKQPEIKRDEMGLTKINSSRTGLNRRSGENPSAPLSGDASRGDERAVHLVRNTLHGAVAYANFAGDLDDAHAGPQTILDALFNG
jgi:hypothetical protein